MREHKPEEVPEAGSELTEYIVTDHPEYQPEPDRQDLEMEFLKRRLGINDLERKVRDLESRLGEYDSTIVVEEEPVEEEPVEERPVDENPVQQESVQQESFQEKPSEEEFVEEDFFIDEPEDSVIEEKRIETRKKEQEQKEEKADLENL